jgi:stage V sporulation protein R
MAHEGFFFRSRRGLPQELVDAQKRIEELARGYGLDFIEIVYEMCDYDEINMIASYGGFPTRYPHWRFGMEYLQMQKGYEYGLQKIYEMVINTVPSYAYLLDNNMMVDQKLVMAHVCGHVDFFTNNSWFQHTNRKMLDQMANHASRVRRYIDRHGTENVESFIDMCLSIENLIDPFAPHIRRERNASESDIEKATLQDGVQKLPAKSYMDSYINPPEYLEEQKKKHRAELERLQTFPAQPTRDVMGFVLKHGKLSRWQQDVMGIIRDEATYFAPQAQTKVMNEGWACLQSGVLTPTLHGMIPIDELVDLGHGTVFDGEQRRSVVDKNVIKNRQIVRIKTRRGLTLGGSANHRLMRPDGSWVRLDELRVGSTLRVSGGGRLWARDMVALTFDVPDMHAVFASGRSYGLAIGDWYVDAQGRAIDPAIRAQTAALLHDPSAATNREPVTLPQQVDVKLASFLGYLIGDGHISLVKRNLGLTTGDASQADRFMDLAGELFGVLCSIQKDEGRWRVLIHSQTVSDFLIQVLGLTHGPSAREKHVPEAILRSPERVVASFLAALFDCDGYAGPAGVILVSASETMISQVQLLLLNFGILSRVRKQKDGCFRLHIMGQSVATYQQLIGFSLARKQIALERYVSSRQWFKKEKWEDEVVSIEHGRADVYDITVEETHRYAAGGFINHNSFWHTFLMTRHILEDSEVIDYADHHSGTVSMSRGQINPYKIGIELFRHIEDRWNKGQFGKDWLECEDVAVKRDWNTNAGLGREKIFEVRKSHNDVTFIDTFLTEDFVREHGLFTYEYDKSAGHFVIDTREFQAVKQKLLSMLSNHGQPRIYVTDANHANRGELELTHHHEGLDIQLDWAGETLGNLAKLWGRPVHLLTAVDNKRVILHHDGTELTTEGLKPRKAESKEGGTR